MGKENIKYNLQIIIERKKRMFYNCEGYYGRNKTDNADGDFC